MHSMRLSIEPQIEIIQKVVNSLGVNIHRFMDLVTDASDYADDDFSGRILTGVLSIHESTLKAGPNSRVCYIEVDDINYYFVASSKEKAAKEFQDRVERIIGNIAIKNEMNKV